MCVICAFFLNGKNSITGKERESEFQRFHCLNNVLRKGDTNKRTTNTCTKTSVFGHWKLVMFQVGEHVRKKALKIPKNWNRPGQLFRRNLLRDGEKSSRKCFNLINWIICLQFFAFWSLSFYVIILYFGTFETFIVDVKNHEILANCKSSDLSEHVENHSWVCL